MWWFKTTEAYCLPVLEARSLRPRCWQGCALKSCQRSSFLCLLLASGGGRQSLAPLGLCASMLTGLLCVCVSLHTSLQGPWLWDLGPPLTLYECILANDLSEDCFQYGHICNSWVDMDLGGNSSSCYSSFCKTVFLSVKCGKGNVHLAKILQDWMARKAPGTHDVGCV